MILVIKYLFSKIGCNEVVEKLCLNNTSSYSLKSYHFFEIGIYGQHNNLS